MALFLVQHGLSASKEKDPEKGLSPQGIEETNRMASVARGYGIPVAKIVHSGKKRAQQTAAIYALALKVPMESLSNINPLDDVRAFAACIDPRAHWMVVGHLPFMERLVSFLVTGDKDIRVYQCQNSGIVCLDCQAEAAGEWYIKWTLNPHIS